MKEVFSCEQGEMLLECCAAIEQRLTKLWGREETPKNGLISFFTAIVSPKINTAHPYIWRQQTEEISQALVANQPQQLAALLNVHALNVAIEAARYQDADLARLAEVLRRFSEEARNFTAKQ